MNDLLSLENIISILIYFLTFLLSSTIIYKGLGLLKKKKIGILLIIIGILIPSILAGIRYGVGGDFFSYLGMYNNLVHGQKMYFRSIEPASTLIITISAYLHCSFLMFFIFSLITNTCFFLAFAHIFNHDSKKTTLSFLIYLCILYSATLFVIRNMAAIAIITLAFSFIFKNFTKTSIIKFFLLVFIAFLFHKTALLALLLIPILWIARRTNTKKVPKILLLLLCVLFAILIPVIYSITKTFIPLGDYTRYLKALGNNFSIPIANIIMTTPIIASALYLYKNKDLEKNDGEPFKEMLYCASFYIPLSITVGWLTMVGANALSRLSFILEPLTICLMSYLVAFSKKMSKIWKVTILLFVIIIVSLMFIRNLNWSISLPYRTVFQGEISNATKN